MNKLKKNNSEEVEENKVKCNCACGEDCKCGENCECEVNPLQKELDETTERMMRIKAEFENYKKREVKEREMLHKTVVSDIVSKMLPAIDNLEHAVNTETSDENYKKGVRIGSKTIHGCARSIRSKTNRNSRNHIRPRTSRSSK